MENTYNGLTVETIDSECIVLHQPFLYATTTEKDSARNNSKRYSNSAKGSDIENGRWWGLNANNSGREWTKRSDASARYIGHIDSFQ